MIEFSKLSLIAHIQPGLLAIQPDAQMRWARPIRLLGQGWIGLSDRLRTVRSVSNMKTCLTASTIALFAAIACATEVPVTVEVEKPVTRVVPETVLVEATREVDVTREVEVTRQVTVTREVPVTRVVVETVQVPVTRTVQVTREVEVTREVVITRVEPAGPASLTPPKPRQLCADYPFIIELGELQLDLYEAQAAVAERVGSDTRAVAKAAVDWFTDRLATTRLNRFQVCGVQPELYGLEHREMQTFEGNAVCSNTLDLVRDVYALNPDWDNAPEDISDAWYDNLDGYVNYCDNDFLE